MSVAELGWGFFWSSDLVKFVHNQRLIEFVMAEEEVKEEESAEPNITEQQKKGVKRHHINRLFVHNLF